MGTKLLAPPLNCARCGAPLDDVRTVHATENGKVIFNDDGWAPAAIRDEISCVNGHRFVAEYEQREIWRRVLVGAGEELTAA